MQLSMQVDGDTILLQNERNTVLKIREIVSENGVILEFDGNLISETEHDVRDELGAIACTGVDMTLDFEKVSGISYACTQAILKTQQTVDSAGNGEMILRNIPDQVMEQFNSVGMTDLLKIDNQR